MLHLGRYRLWSTSLVPLRIMGLYQNFRSRRLPVTLGSMSSRYDPDPAGSITPSMVYILLAYVQSLLCWIERSCINIDLFCKLRDLKCLRNTIHTNLMATYMLSDTIWMLTHPLQVSDTLLVNERLIFVPELQALRFSIRTAFWNICYVWYCLNL